MHKRILTSLLCIAVIVTFLPLNVVFSDNDKSKRVVYLHAQGENLQETKDVSTVYIGETANVYFAVDNPNKGLYENGVHKEPQYDMNGYTVKIYFDHMYFDFASDGNSLIDYTVPNTNLDESDTDEEMGEQVPVDIGYFVYRQGSDTRSINGKNYKSAYITVFFSGTFLPQKDDGALWYNLCKLPLKPLKTGSTNVFIDTSGNENNDSLVLFAKNASEDINDQTFDYTTINGGYHNIVIKDKSKPAPPLSTPQSGSYTEKQMVELTAESDCKIYYSTDNGQNYTEYTSPIEIEITTTINCYTKRESDGKESNKVNYTYRILPKSPFLFKDSNGSKDLIPNIYSEEDIFTVYASDKDSFGQIEADSEIYYTFADLPIDNITDMGTDPQTQWVKLDKITQSINIERNQTVKLVTSKMAELSDISWYYLGIKPATVIASHSSGEYDDKIDVTLSCATTGAKIYYTIDGSDPISNGIEYENPITLAKDTTLRAVAKNDKEYSYISSYYYLFNFYDDYGVDAFYPAGVYQGSVNVTLTSNNPENTIRYSTDGGIVWNTYANAILIDKDTVILAKAVGKNGDEGAEYKFTYKIKPLPPSFAPNSTQFTNSDKITIYCVESTAATTERYELYYTLDGSDPITSETRIKADESSDSAIIDIKKYTVVSAVVKKDNTTYSTVVKHSYDIVYKKPVRPMTTLTPGSYTKKTDSLEGFAIQFLPVPDGTNIFYTIGHDGAFVADPVPNTAGTYAYDATPIEIKGKTTVKAVAVNVFGVKSDIGIFEYIIKSEAPKAPPSATIAGVTLPVIPVSAVKGSTVRYTINGFSNEFISTDGSFYIDTQTGNAYKDEACTEKLGFESSMSFSSPATLDIWAFLDGVECEPNRYVYALSGNPSALAPPYADRQTGEYEEIKIDDENNLLHVKLYSLNSEDAIQYRIDNQGTWMDYNNNGILIKKDTILQLRSQKNGNYSTVASYVYNFVPLAPVITLPSGSYTNNPAPTTKIEYDDRIPSDRNYSIFYRSNGDKDDFRYTGQEREITHTMSFKAYVLNHDTGKISKNTIHYYIIESKSVAIGSVYIANPYDVERIGAHVLNTGDYADGIKLLTQSHNYQINYYYSYTKTDGTSFTTNNLVYDNAAPIMVNSSMDKITIYAWLTDNDGNRIQDSEMTHTIDFIHLNIPVTSLGSEKIEFSKGTKYKLINDYPTDDNMLLYYTLNGSDPADNDNPGRAHYKEEELIVSKAVTVKAVYFSACGKCVECNNNNKADCLNGVYGEVGVYKYTVPTIKNRGGVGSGGSAVPTAVETRKYTSDVFGNEHPTHIGYINGYPDGSVRPEGEITREEIAVILYRIKKHPHDAPFAATGEVFPDVPATRWAVLEIEYMADNGVVLGYPDGEFKPTKKLTRSEFAAIINRFAKLWKPDAANIFSDLEKTHWAYDDILSLREAGLLSGYEDGTFKPENLITRAEVMVVINKLLGRNPSEAYIKSLNYNPFNDLDKDKWYYVTVLEATITHSYHLDSNGIEVKWDEYR